MIGGEIHYWRVQRTHWDAILESAKGLGIDIVATYVPWAFHEVREGEYDFALLEDFLTAVERHGMKVFARPGPFIYAEYRNWGIADHATPYHKLHPEFQKKAAQWIAAVMRVLRPYLGTRVVAVQADNEIDPMLYYYGEDLGFADWLAGRYGSVDAWNAAWGTEYASFAEAMPTLTPFVDDRRFRDGCQYRYDLATQYARWVVNEYRRNGCTVPIALNTWPGVDAQHWHDLADLADIYGIDPYPPNECKSGLRYFRERLRLLRAVTDFPYLAEFASGIWHGMPDRSYTADHYRLTALTALAAGVRGWNWYMLVDRDNWTGAPINERGVARSDLYAAFAEAVDHFRTLEGAPPPETSFAVTWSWRCNQIAQIRKQDLDDPLFVVLHEMGIEYDLVDVDRDFTAPALLMVGGEVEQPDRVWQYVEQGGHLVMFQSLIEGVPRPDGTSYPFMRSLKCSWGFMIQGPVFTYRRVPGEPITARQEAWAADEDERRLMEAAVGREYTIGYREQRGKGSVTVLGCPPSADAMVAVHRQFGLSMPARPLTAGVFASKRGEYLIVVNPGEAKSARVDVGGRVRRVDLPRCSGVVLGPRELET
ncbi:MAG: beta-galactosidase [Phycisphaerae bacterium]|nr:beta-galactosidase [Phycisphaerae bacterium]